MDDVSQIQTSAETEEKLDFKRILPVLVIVLIDLLGLTIIIPLLPLYATSFGANAFTIGLLSATYPILQFVGAPLLGRLSDRFGRKPVLVISQIGTFIGFVLLGLADTLWLLFLSRVIDGISGANIATAMAVITDSTSSKTRTQGLGLIGAAFGIGFIIGPIIAFAALAATNNNYQAPAYIAAGFSLISILLTIFWLKETLPPEKRGQANGQARVGLAAMFRALRRPEVGFLLGLMFAQQFAFGGFEHLLALFTLTRLGLNAAGNAILFVFVGIIIVIVQGGLVGRWSRRFGDRWLVVMGLSVLGLALIMAAITPKQPVPWYSQAALVEEFDANSGQPNVTGSSENIQIDLPDDSNTGWLGLAWLLIALIPAAIGGGVLQPSINSLITKRVSAADIGGTLGVSAAFYSAANALAPLLLGAVFQAIGSTAPFLIGGIILLILWPLAAKNIHKPA